MEALSESLRLRDEALRVRKAIKSGELDLSLERLRVRVGRWNRVVGDDPPGPLFKGVVSEFNAILAARSAAYAVHAVAQKLHAASDGSGSINEAERAFTDVLSLLRLGAISRDKSLVAAAFTNLIGPVFDRVIATKAMIPADGNSDEAMDAVRAFHLIHRISAVAAAIPLLQLRQLENRSDSALSRIADRRTDLEMPGLPNNETVSNQISGHNPLDRIDLIGFAESATWVDRPERPYTRLSLANGEELRVHFKNIRRVGITGGQWIWAQCKVEEPVDDLNYAVAEFEGPTTHDNICWESWLQTTARDYYDITPGSVHIYTANINHPLDVYARLANQEESDND